MWDQYRNIVWIYTKRVLIKAALDLWSCNSNWWESCCQLWATVQPSSNHDVDGCFRGPKTSFPLHLHGSIQTKIERSALSGKKSIGPCTWEKHRTNRRLSKMNRREHVGRKTPCREGEERQHESTRTNCWRLMKRACFAGVWGMKGHRSKLKVG